MEEKYLQKNFHLSVLENDASNVVGKLGSLLLEEDTDKDSIRFAQGEVYFKAKDFEAAIFKWGKIENHSYQPWAAKNMGDAYFELKAYKEAEKMYVSVVTESETLQAEVSLQLFALYIEDNNVMKAKETIKLAVSKFPDYPNVTTIARSFYEEQQDWEEAVELAASEAIRTQELDWYKYVLNYVENGLTAVFAPEYFSPFLHALYHKDVSLFQDVSVALWNSYEGTGHDHLWLLEFNHLLVSLELTHPASWSLLTNKYRETVAHFIGGQYSMQESGQFVPSLLVNWFRISQYKEKLYAATTILAWVEVVSSEGISVLSEAQDLIQSSEESYIDNQETVALFHSIKQFVTEEKMDVGHKVPWLMEALMDDANYHMVVAGERENTLPFLRQLVHANPLMQDSVPIIYQHAVDSAFISMTNRTKTEYNLNDHISISDHDALVLANDHYPFLAEHQLSILSLSENMITREELYYADGLLFVVNPASSLTREEYEMLVQMQEKRNQLPLYFVIRTDASQSHSQIEDCKSELLSFFPDSQVVIYQYDNQASKQQFGAFIDSLHDLVSWKRDRSVHMLAFLREFITFVLQQRVHLETALVETVRWNEDMHTKLKAAAYQIEEDIQNEKARSTYNAYIAKIDKFKAKVKQTVPSLLQGFANSINEESDFSTLQQQLNSQMNDSIRQFVQHDLLPELYTSLQEWLSFANEACMEGQMQLEEMKQGFNALFEAEKFVFQCDFRLIEDWRRDFDRMTTFVDTEEMNILNRFSPSQFILKSAGKLFGSIPQNKAMLANKYKKWIQSEEYQEITDALILQIFQPLDLFGRSIHREFSFFFREPRTELEETIEELAALISMQHEKINQMQTEPEKFQDPIRYFQIKLRQLEILSAKKQEPVYEA